MSASTPPGAPGAAFIVTHLLGASFFWASGFLLIKLSAGMSPLALAACRGLIAVVALGAWFTALGHRLRPGLGEAAIWLLLGMINGWLPNVLTALALAHITAAEAAMIQATTPLFVALLAHLAFAEERLSLARFAGILVGFAGMALLIGPAVLGLGGASLIGVSAMIVSAVSYALGALAIRAAPHGDPARLAFGQQLFSGLPALGLALCVEGTAGFAQLPQFWLPVLALGVLATAVPNVFFMRLIRRAGPTRASMTSYLIPVWAAAMSTALIGERVGLRELVGGIIILVGVYLVNAKG
jgi:drug/metabolite transporter (DMT)-like permease